MEEKGPLTMKDIAKEFGISVATVSRALKDSPRISTERRQAIQQYAREHNFAPNMIAESLRNSRVKPQKLIGVIGLIRKNYLMTTSKESYEKSHFLI